MEKVPASAAAAKPNPKPMLRNLKTTDTDWGDLRKCWLKLIPGFGYYTEHWTCIGIEHRR